MVLDGVLELNNVDDDDDGGGGRGARDAAAAAVHTAPVLVTFCIFSHVIIS